MEDQHYCYDCLTLIPKSQMSDHLKRGHDVDINSQAFYEEQERTEKAMKHTSKEYGEYRSLDELVEIDSYHQKLVF